MKKYLAYTRVSTTRQGEQGVSLQQQKESIERYAVYAGIEIVDWLEEQETAAKQGRPVFLSMLKKLRKREAAGVVMHKIDRSARNLKDWAELGQLIDQGVEVHFSNESVDLTSRGGRLSADIQAVVAADYIRNLREEVKKGFYGRLRQGISPLPAPLGYLNPGPGKAKTIDPEAGPIIREGFDLYATGRYSQEALTGELNRLGLRTRRGKPVTENVVSHILSNPFYMGIIRLRRSGQVFKGAHAALVSPQLFERVQGIIAGRSVRGPGIHQFEFSRFIKCESCGRSLIAERQKGIVYYRCHVKGCPPTCVRQDAIRNAIANELKSLRLQLREISWIEEFAAEKKLTATSTLDAEVKHLRLQASALDDRQNRLTDALIDGAIERADYEKRKAALLMERCTLEARIAAVEVGKSEQLADVEKKVELIKHAWLLHKEGLTSESRDLVTELTSNRSASGKTLTITLQTPLAQLVERHHLKTGGAVRGVDRTFWERWLSDSSTDEL